MKVSSDVVLSAIAKFLSGVRSMRVHSPSVDAIQSRTTRAQSLIGGLSETGSLMPPQAVPAYYGCGGS